VDARLRSDGYAGLVFNPCTASGGDVWSRWQVRRDECLQAFRLIEEAGSARTTAAEAPRGAVRIVDSRIETPSRRHVTLLKALLPGLLWDEAVMCIASLDLDMEEAALR
jgi:Ni,Fe-hydrogenase III large subunit